MAFDKDAMVEQLSGLTVLELVDLLDSLKEKWGVEAAVAMPVGAMMVPQGGAADAGAGADEKTEFTVSISSAGEKKLQVIKAVRAIVAGLGLKEAKELVESNGVVRADIAKEEADEIKTQLEEAGASVEVK
jgi:large subunit ribosomal protein L7/L12